MKIIILLLSLLCCRAITPIKKVAFKNYFRVIHYCAKNRTHAEFSNHVKRLTPSKRHEAMLIKITVAFATVRHKIKEKDAYPIKSNKVMSSLQGALSASRKRGGTAAPHHRSPKRLDNDNDDGKNISQGHKKRRNNSKSHAKRKVENPVDCGHPREAQAHNQVARVDHNNEGQEEHSNSNGVLWWLVTDPHFPAKCEQDMLKVILRWGKKERGMLKDQPEFRRRQIQDFCHRNRISILLACSLRRHHMSELNPFLSKPALRLGSEQNIRDAARLFENAIAHFLRNKSIEYFTEQEQKQRASSTPGEELVKGTPDFLLKNPVLLNEYSLDRKNQRRIHSQRKIHWLEAKMFYGASTIPEGKKSAVGTILPKMRIYVKLHGEGAIVFSQGCGESLASQLAEIGVTALSCSSHEFDFSKLQSQQRTWCADQHGNILP
jgi:Protein of unknown function TPD sequence-motif